MNAKGAGPSALEGRGSYASAITGSPKFVSSDYVQSSGHGYGHKGDQLYADKIPDYPVPDRHQYGERHSAYIGKDLQSEQTGRYADSIGFSNQNQVLHFCILSNFVIFYLVKFALIFLWFLYL